MAGMQSTEGVPPSLAGMSKIQLYDIMCQMKGLIEQNHQQARQILIQNPVLTRALFQAQIMLGMVQPPQAVSTISPAASQNSQQAVMLSQQSNVQAATAFSGQSDHNQVRKQQSSQSMTSKPQSQSIPPPNSQSQSLPSPLTPIQQPKGHLESISTPLSTPSQVRNVPPVPHQTARPPSSLHQISMEIPSLPTQQPPLQSTSSQYLAPQQPLQPPLPAQPRQQIPAFHRQGHGQMGPNLGFQHPGGQQLHHSQTMFHSAAGGPGNLGPSFLPPLPSQPLPPSLYQTRGPRSGMELNQVGGSNQTGRGSSWMSGMPDIKGFPFSGPPYGAGQMGANNQPPRPPPLTPDLEKALLQQVVSLTPEQISMLPADQRNQILQLQQLLRQ